MKPSNPVLRSILAAAGLIVLAGCPTPPPTVPETPTVTVTSPVERDVVDFAEFTGTTKAAQTLEIRARIQGVLLNVAKYTDGKENDFVEGSIVEEGALLFAIEPDTYKARVEKAEAVIEQAQAQVKLAEANYSRTAELYQKGVAPQQEFDIAVANRDAAMATLRRSEADLRQAEIDLGYSEIRAPFTGRVGRRLVDEGNLVGATGNTLLSRIEQTNPMYAYFDVNERIVLKIQRWRREHDASEGGGAPIKVFLGLADEDGCPHEGHLDFVDNTVDPSTGTALVRGVFPNDDGLLYPGLFVRLRVPGEEQKGALLVEEKAIGTDLEGKYLLVVGDDGKVEPRRRVEVGSLVDGMRVILSGISPDERYVVRGLQHARPGTPVKTMVAEPEQPVPTADRTDPNAETETLPAASTDPAE